MKKLFAVFMFGLFLAGTCVADEARLLRFPHVSADKVAFVYGGDIYTAPRTGGAATRLTSHEGLELFPKFSPDGSMIAFNGQYDGDMSVYVMPVDGGMPLRLTYHPGIQRTSERFGPENIVMGWHPEEMKVLFRSRKESHSWWEGRAYLVDIEGGLPEPLPMATAGFTAFSPDCSKIAYCPIFRDFRTWKRYKGGMAQDVWIFDLNTMAAEKITDWIGTDNMPMWYRDRIYFNSDRTGVLNIYCYDTRSKTIRQVTSFSDYDVRWPSLGSDGIAFENGGYLYVMDLPSERVNKVYIDLTTDYRSMRPEYENVSDNIRDFDISPDGKRAVFDARGDIFTVPAQEGNTRNITKSPGSRERRPEWSPDGRWIVVISDETGEEEIFLISQDGKEKVQLTTGGYCHKYRPSWSPDGTKLVYSDRDLKLYSIEVKSKKIRVIDKADRNEIRNYAWSPDSRYLAYNKVEDNGINAIFVYSFADNKIHQVTAGFTNDFAPEFDPDGRYLYFLSQRNFNPILSNYEFSFVNQAITDLYLIILSADQPSPFAPKSDEVVVKEKDAGKKKKKDKKEDEEKPVEVKIDFDGIYDRQVAFDLPAGNYGGLTAIPGAVFYTSNPLYGLTGKIGDEETELHKYVLEDEKDHVYASGISNWATSFDRELFLIQKRDNYYIEKTAGDKAALEESLDLSDMNALVDRNAEYAQMLREVWRMERDFFYDENMHGVDWDMVWEKYEPLLPFVACRYDLTYLIGEMIGELCCSHTYVGGGDYQRIPSSKIGLLGVDFEIDRENDRIRIGRILEGQNWDEDLVSPLLEPGLDVKEGDYLIAINGYEITSDVNPYVYTENTVGQTVTLTLSSRPDGSKARDVVVKPITSEENLRYYDWVMHRKNYVDSTSDGRIGYIHIPDMDSFGLVRFVRMFYHQFKRPGLIIDVRYNGGGFVSGLILERLRRVVVAMSASRRFKEDRIPGSGIHAHMITLQNQFSCSDGDYFPYFFRQYDLGPLMGVRTWGGVVGIRGYRRLIDGGYYTIPEFSIYNLDGEWIMENVGVYPDIEIKNTPDRTALGYDDQLDTAVDNILDRLKVDPEILPPKPGYPEER